MTASTKKAQGGAKGKRHDGPAQVAEALYALYGAGAFDFINNMFGRTVADVSARLGIAPPAKFGDPQERPTVEDFAAWLAKIPPTFDPADEQEGERAHGLDLAELISAVLTHPDTPSRIYNALGEAVSELASKDAVQNRPEVIRAALAVHKAEQEEGGNDA